MRTNIPLVATDRHTHTQILNKDMAELVAPDKEGLSQGVLRILRNPDRGREIAANARRFADSNFSDDKYIEMVWDLYQQVIEGSTLVQRLV